VRDVDLDAEHPLSRLVAEKPEVIHLVRITAANKEDNLAAAQVIKDKYGKVDVIIANAGKFALLKLGQAPY
jgi:NADP-dependent 3-hydroxy acid dehydrogenase YdfG